MAPVAGTHRIFFCLLWRPYNLQPDHMTYADTSKDNIHLCYKQCSIDGLHSEEIECLNPGHDAGAIFHRRRYLQWKETRKNEGACGWYAWFCGSMLLSKYLRLLICNIRLYINRGALLLHLVLQVISQTPHLPVEKWREKHRGFLGPVLVIGWLRGLYPNHSISHVDGSHAWHSFDVERIALYYIMCFDRLPTLEINM